MKKFLLAIAFASCLQSAAAEESVVKFGRFGNVKIYKKADHPSNVVLLVSGRGWDINMVGLANHLAAMDATVVGINISHYLKRLKASKEKCSYPVSDFEELSRFVQKKMGSISYVPPVLVGYSAGGGFVYGLLAQAPAGTFKGAISMGFCPRIALSKPLCRGRGLEMERPAKGHVYRFLAAQDLDAPWVVFQGEEDHVCEAGVVEAYVKQVPHADVVLLPRVGHTFLNSSDWLPQFQETFRQMVMTEDATPPSVNQSTKGLPLIEVLPAGPEKDFFVVIVSGDGGWAGIDRQIAKTFKEQGIPVVGLNSLKYFWKRKTPEMVGADLDRILRHYFSAWGKKSVLLVGYSRGADALPFMISRLPADLSKKIKAIALLGLETSGELEIHAGTIFNLSSKREQPLRPEVEKLKGQKIICFYGEDDDDALCPNLPADLAETIQTKGGHHFGGDYRKIALEILRRSE